MKMLFTYANSSPPFISRNLTDQISGIPYILKNEEADTLVALYKKIILSTVKFSKILINEL